MTEHDKERQAFEAAAETEFRNEPEFTRRDFEMALRGWKMARAQQPAQDVSGLVDALHSMACAYKSAITSGYDRITALGGTCDNVQYMLNQYSDYKKALDMVAAHRGQQPTNLAVPSAPEEGTPNACYDIEAAAKKLAECMDYPWEYMPEQGRENMRKNARAVIEAGLKGNGQ